MGYSQIIFSIFKNIDKLCGGEEELERKKGKRKKRHKENIYININKKKENLFSFSNLP